MGSISISTTSPYTNAVCTRRLPVSGGFNAYAILVDFDANAGQDVKCYFPEFKIYSNLVVQAEFKLVYGDSFPPDLTSNKQYGSVFRTTSNSLSFSGSTPDMSSGYVTTMNSLSESPNFYSATTTVSSTFSSTYTITGTWSIALSTPFIYLNYMKAGPVPAVSFCIDSNIFYECRVYNNRLNLVVAKLKSSASSFSMSRGSMDILYPSSQWSTGSDFNGYAYISNGNQWRYSRSVSRSQSSLAPISSNSFLVYTDSMSSSRSTFRSTVLISMNIVGRTLFKYIDTGSKLTVAFSGITQKSSCQIWVQYEPTVELICVVAANLITIYSERADYSTSNNIFVSLGIVNPSSASSTFTMILYDYYFSSSLYSVVISKTATLTIDNSYFTNTAFDKSRVSMYPYRSRFTLTANAPLRIRFKLSSSSVTYAATYSGYFSVTNTQISYSTKFLCFFRQYATYTALDQQTEYIEMKADSYSVSGSRLNIVPPKSMSISSSYYYELVVMPIGISAGGCTAHGCASQSGFQQSNFETINFLAYSSSGPSVPTLVNSQSQALYKYDGPSMIGLQEIYVLCA